MKLKEFFRPTAGRIMLFIILFYLIFGFGFNFGMTFLVSCTVKSVEAGTCNPNPRTPPLEFGFIESFIVSLIISYLLSCIIVYIFKMFKNRK